MRSETPSYQFPPAVLLEPPLSRKRILERVGHITPVLDTGRTRTFLYSVFCAYTLHFPSLCHGVHSGCLYAPGAPGYPDAGYLARPTLSGNTLSARPLCLRFASADPHA